MFGPFLKIENFFSVYVETGRSSTATTVQLVTLAATTGAKWRIRTTFIECSCPNLPDQGCTQVHNLRAIIWNGVTLKDILIGFKGSWLSSLMYWFSFVSGSQLTLVTSWPTGMAMGLVKNWQPKSRQLVSGRTQTSAPSPTLKTPQLHSLWVSIPSLLIKEIQYGPLKFAPIGIKGCHKKLAAHFNLDPQLIKLFEFKFWLLTGTTIAGAETTACTIAAVYIPNSQPSGAYGGFNCGTFFADTDAAMASGSITQSCPFRISHRYIVGYNFPSLWLSFQQSEGWDPRNSSLVECRH